MSAKVRFLGILKEYQPKADANGFWTVEPGRSVKSIEEESGVEATQWEYFVLVNGEPTLRAYELKDGDVLDFTTIFAGG